MMASVIAASQGFMMLTPAKGKPRSVQKVLSFSRASGGRVLASVVPSKLMPSAMVFCAMACWLTAPMLTSTTSESEAA